MGQRDEPNLPSRSTAFRAGCGPRVRARSSAFSPGLAGCRAGSRFSTRWPRAHRDRAVAAGFSGRRARPYRARQPSRLGAGGARAAAKAGLDGADLAGSSVGGSFAAEIAAIWPQSVRRLALIAPFGLFDDNDPATDPWAQRAARRAGAVVRRPGALERSSRPRPRAPTRRNGRSSRPAPARPPPAPSGRSATPGSKSACR